mgnify:FL=1
MQVGLPGEDIVATFKLTKVVQDAMAHIRYAYLNHLLPSQQYRPFSLEQSAQSLHIDRF